MNEHAPFRFYEYGVFVPEGLSSFYSELMKGFGAGSRLWELLDRKPEFPLNGKHTYIKRTLTKCVRVTNGVTKKHVELNISRPLIPNRGSSASSRPAEGKAGVS